MDEDIGSCDGYLDEKDCKGDIAQYNEEALCFEAFKWLNDIGLEDELLQGAQMTKPPTPYAAKEISDDHESHKPKHSPPEDLCAKDPHHKVLKTGNHTRATAIVKSHIDERTKKKD